MNDKTFFKTGKYLINRLGQYNGLGENITIRCSDREVP